jgi:hypothetical protein
MYIMTYKRGGRKSRRGGQDDDTEAITNNDETTPMDEEEEEDGTTTSTAMAGGKRRVKSVIMGRAGGRSRRRRGGQSANAYEMNTVGNGQTQWSNVFSNPQTMNAPTGNGLWSADLTQNVNGVRPADPSLGKLMQGGKRRHKRSRRGGNLLDIVSQAAVPFGLLGLQQTYSKRRRGGRKSRKGGRKSRRHSRKILA